MHAPYASLPMAFSLGAPEMIAIVFLVLLLFGAKRLPELAKGLGKSVKEFKRATNDVEEDLRTAIHDDPRPAPKKPESTGTVPPPSTP